MKEKEIIYEVNPQEFVNVLAEKLKKIKEFRMPEWALFVKTSVARERPPQERDWWYKRAASILKEIFKKGVVGVSRLSTRYGGRKNRGMAPEKFYKGGRKIIRTILQQAEKTGFVEKAEGKKKGRKLTKKGLQFLIETAKEIKEKIKT